MPVRLLARHGPLAGLEVALPEGRVVLGRGSACTVVLDDASVSREHCELAPGPDGFTLRDLGSKNGTSVNGIPVDGSAVTAGDLLRIGRTIFEVSLDGEETPDPGPATTGGTATVTLAWPAPGTHESGATELAIPVVEGLSGAALVAVAEAVSGGGGPGALLGAVCDAVCDALPVTRAAGWLFALPGGRDVRAARGRGGTVLARAVLPEPIVARVRAAGESVLATDLALDPREAPAGATTPFCQAVAAPLRAAGRAVGVLYADTAGGTGTLDASHLAFLRAAAACAGPALAAAQAASAPAAIARAGPAPPELIGKSPAMRKVFEMVRRVAPTPSTILITGPSGSGKELVARAIHGNSPRRAGPLVAVNCAALPRELVEAELFGHERGAFTGAVARRPGRFEQASGGTLFLDEVGDLPLDAQAKLLRVCEERRVMRVGGTQEVPVDVRILAATNKDLRAAVEAGTFREDLFFRLAGVELALPPLRDRRDDIPYLAALFLERLREETGHHIEGFEPEALALLGGYPWPGNVRELRNTIERAAVFAAGPRLRPLDFQFLEVHRASAPPEELPTLREVERRHITRVLEQVSGNKSRAARILGIERSTLYEKLKGLGL